MTPILLVSSLILWALTLLLGFLLLGVLRAQGLLTWRLDQLEATMPSRIGRSGLAPGKRAPDFTLPIVKPRPQVAESTRDSGSSGNVSLSNFAGRSLLLVFVQSGCGPCHEIVPELNRLRRRRGDLALVAINHASPQDAQQWAEETRAEFPVLVQEDWSVSKRYEAFATPFAFLIDEQGVVRSKGIVAKRQHLDFLLSAAEKLSATETKTQNLGVIDSEASHETERTDVTALRAAADM